MSVSRHPGAPQAGQGTLSDPVLRLLNAAGTTELAFNDDSGGTLESSIIYTASQTGTFYLSVEAFLSGTGTFRLSAADVTGGTVADRAITGTSGSDVLLGSAFNDDVQMGFLDVFDQYILNILYDPRIRPGMTRDEVRALLPAIIPDARAFVARTNDLKP